MKVVSNSIGYISEAERSWVSFSEVVHWPKEICFQNEFSEIIVNFTSCSYIFLIR